MRDYTNRYCRAFLRLGTALLILGVLNYVLRERPETFLAACVTLLLGLSMKVFPLVRITVDQIEIHRGLLRSKIVVPFAAIRGIDEAHSKFIRISIDDGEFRIQTAALKKGDRASLLEDIRMGTKQARASSQGAP